MGLAWVAIQIICAWLAADFLSGFWHWVEDRYFDTTWPVIGEHIAKPNLLHHSQPAAFLHQGYFSRNWTTILPAAIAAAIAWYLSAPWAVVLTFVFVSQANEIHAWAHQRSQYRIIRGLQEIGLLQSMRHHGGHHTSPYNIRYCVMSDWINWALDRSRFWYAIEYCLAQIGVHIRADIKQLELDHAGANDRPE